MGEHRNTRVVTLVALVGLLVGLVASPALAAKPVKSEGEPVPAAMASLGDSITRGFNACGWFFDCTSRSWSTGADNGVTSHFERLQALDPTMSTAYNHARTGAKVNELPGQAADAVASDVGYVTILIGANDACTSSEDTMTSVEQFRSYVDDAMADLAGGLPGAKVFVSSIPDIYRLWEVGKDSSSARYAWATYDICQSMLEDPLSTDQADEDRRQRVRQRVIAYNAELADACAAYGDNCRYDGDATFSYPFELDHLSGWDYFHPNTTGQNILAEETWKAGFTWAEAKKGGGNGGGKGNNK